MSWPQPLTHPPTNQPMHPPIGGGVSTDFKSSNRIKISRLMGTTWGGDHGDNGGDHGDHSHGDHMGTFWGQWGLCGDDGDDTGMMWGQQG